MKRKLGYLLATILLVLLLQPLTALASDSYVRATGAMNVRSSPSLDGTLLGTISKGATASYLDKSSVDDRGVRWYKISYKSGSGWVSSRYGDLVNDYDDQLVRATGNLNVRSTPSLDGTLLGTIYEGGTASYLNKSSVDDRGVRWYKISYKSGSGWVSSRYGKLVDYDDYDDDDDSYDYDSGYVRATGNLNVRSSPSLDGSNYGTITEGGTATYLGSSSVDDRGVRWYKISYKGGSGWVSSRYCKLVSWFYAYVKATGGDLNVRNKPSLSGKQLGTIYEGGTATYLDASSTDDRGVLWYKISYKGDTGWVSSMYSELYY